MGCHPYSFPDNTTHGCEGYHVILTAKLVGTIPPQASFFRATPTPPPCSTSTPTDPIQAGRHRTTVLTRFVIRIRSDCRDFCATTPGFVYPLEVTPGPPGFVHRSYIHPLGGIRGNQGRKWPGMRDRAHLGKPPPSEGVTIFTKNTHFLLSSKRPNTRSNHDMALSLSYLILPYLFTLQKSHHQDEESR